MSPQVNTSATNAHDRISHLNEAEHANQTQRTTPATNDDLVVAPEYVSVSGTIELLKLMLETSRADKKSLKAQRQSVEKAQVAAEKAEVKELREQAAAKFQSAVVGGLIGIGGGLLGGAAGGAEFGGAIGHHAVRATADLVQKSLTSAAEAAKGSAQLTTGVMTHSAELHGVAAKESEVAANALRRSSENLKSDIDDVKQHDRKLMDMVREIETAMHRCTQIALQSR